MGDVISYTITAVNTGNVTLTNVVITDTMEGRELGFVNEVVEPSQLLEAARRWADQILECAPLSVRGTKQAAQKGLDAPSLEEAVNGRYELIHAMLKSEDYIEGARAFTLWGAELIDRAHLAGDAEAEGLISLLTPVIKGFESAHILVACSPTPIAPTVWAMVFRVKMAARDWSTLSCFNSLSSLASLGRCSRRPAMKDGVMLNRTASATLHRNEKTRASRM